MKSTFRLSASVLLLIIIFILIVLVSVNNNNQSEINRNEWPEYNSERNVQLKDLEFMYKGMKFSEIEKELGEPDRCVGYGFTTCNYIINKNSYITIPIMDENNIVEVFFVKDINDDSNYVNYFEMND